MVERDNGIVEVRGSTPLLSTTQGGSYPEPPCSILGGLFHFRGAVPDVATIRAATDDRIAMPGTPRLPRLLAALTKRHGAVPTPTRDAWLLILRENVAYLVDDARRDQAMARLDDCTGFAAKKILACPDELLLAVCGGGKLAPKQVQKLRSAAALFVEVGDPRKAVTLPRSQAKKVLGKFPGIGEPGVDKLRLFAGAEPVLALDSNGLRVLLRLGYGHEAKNYATSYRSAQAAASAELPADCEVRIAAFGLLRRHGQELCKNSRPRCGDCPLAGDCPAAGA